MKIKKLNKLIINIFKKHGLNHDHASICSKALINAELVGANSHGLARIGSYCNRILKKVINTKPNIKIRRISKSITHINADNAVGFIGADLGINQSIKNAKKTGIGLVAVKNSGHYGLSGYYAERGKQRFDCFVLQMHRSYYLMVQKKFIWFNPICFLRQQD